MRFEAWDIATAVYAARGRPPHLCERQFARMLGAGGHFWEHIGKAPMLLIACVARRWCRRAPVCRFRNSASMRSDRISDFVAPDVENRLAIEVLNEGHQALLEFVF